VWQEACSDRSLYAGNVYVKNSSFVAMFFFPLIFSKALVNGMHMSPGPGPRPLCEPHPYLSFFQTLAMLIYP
jgi:hypothetical protein